MTTVFVCFVVNFVCFMPLWLNLLSTVLLTVCAS